MSAENIRDEVNRGGRLIVYTYCISILVMTFKRSTDIRLIKAGHNPISNGLPFTLVSLIFGWWGFPWGPIYTIETIYRNLSGGIDVTDDVMRALLPTAAVTAQAKTTAAPPTLRVDTPVPVQGFNYRSAGLMIGGAAALIFGGISIYCYNATQNLTVVLVSGLNQPYGVTLNGVDYRLGIRGSRVLTLPEGDFVLKDATGSNVLGSPVTLNFSAPFFSHLFEEHVAIINPDRTAILLNEQVPYYNNNTTAPANEEPSYTVLVNQQSYFIAKPDYVLEKPPQNISMPARTTRLVKTELENVTKGEIPDLIAFINEKQDYAAARDFIMGKARWHADEATISAAVQTLKPEDHRAFFLSRLSERPVLVDWHRYYQSSSEFTSPEADLITEYRGYLKADPNNGALMYLLGRIATDRVEARNLFRQALAAPLPCPHAHGALAFDAMNTGRFEEALTLFNAAEKAGVTSKSRSRYRRESYWGLHQYDIILAEVRAERKDDPMDLELAGDEIRATLAGHPDGNAAEKIKAAYLDSLKQAKSDAKTISESDDYLRSIIAYQTGRIAEYAKLVARFDYPFYKFSAALSQGELEPATKAILSKPKAQATDLLLLYLLAKRQGDEVKAEQHFTKALEVMQHEHGFKQAAVLLTAAQPAAPESICELSIDASDKCILLTALGVRDPAHQSVYHGLAAKLDCLPDFPHHFLRGFLQPAKSASL